MEHKLGKNDVKSPWTYTGYRTIWTLEWIPQIIHYGYLGFLDYGLYPMDTLNSLIIPGMMNLETHL